MKPNSLFGLIDGARCRVIASSHNGKSGSAKDIKAGKTGHASITVVQSGGERFKTIARNVLISAQAA